MDATARNTIIRKKRRALRVRSQITGTATTPRMTVVKSNRHVQVQLIDDERHVTLMGLSTQGTGRKNKAAATALGEEIASKALAAGITSARFDRGPFKYHGVLAALADAARNKGLQL